MDVLEILENHEARIRRLEKSLKDIIDNGLGGLKIFNSITDFPNPGQPGFIYLDEFTGISYYWDGTQYLPFSHSELAFQAYATKTDFPATGAPGVLYLAEDTGNLYFWNGSAYVNSGGGLKVYPNVASFPQPGEPTFIYYAQLEKTLWFWDGTQYVPLVDPKDFIQNQFAVDQPANFRIAGQGMISTPGLPGLVLKASVGGTGSFIEFQTQTKTQGYFIFAPGDRPEFNLQHGASSVSWTFQSGILVSPPSAGSGHTGLQLGDVWFGKTTPTTGYGAGPDSMFLYDAGLNKYRFVIKPNGNWIIGNVPGQDNGAAVQITDGPLSLQPTTADPAVINGALFYRADTNKFRAGVNGLWKNLATEDSILDGRTLHVNNLHPNATDVRAGLDRHSVNVPFATIQAAVNAATQAESIIVHAGIYQEHVVFIAKNNLKITYIDATHYALNANTPALEFGYGNVSNYYIKLVRSCILGTGVAGDQSTSTIRFTGNTNYVFIEGDWPTGYELNRESYGMTHEQPSYIYSQNSGAVDGWGIWGAIILVKNLAIDAGDIGVGSYTGASVENCSITSRNSYAVTGPITAVYSRLVGKLGSVLMMSNTTAGPYRYRSCYMESSTGAGITGGGLGGQDPQWGIINNCHFKVFGRVLEHTTGNGGIAYGWEISRSTFEITNPAITTAIALPNSGNTTDSLVNIYQCQSTVPLIDTSGMSLVTVIESQNVVNPRTRASNL